MRLLDYFRRPAAIADIPALTDFLDGRSAFIVQKCIFEYSRARSGLLSSKLFKEPAFLAALDESRWRNYPLALQNVALMAEHALRPDAAEVAAAMREGLIACVARICARYPLPTGFEPGFWDGALERVARRLRQAGLAAPHAIKDLPHETAKEFFAQLPIHPEIRGFDFQLITNNVRANLCRAYEEFLAAADRPALVRALVAEAALVEGRGGV
jgi:hypothetical protein